MLAPEEVIPSYRVLMPQIEGVPLAASNISETRDGLINLAGTRNLKCKENPETGEPLLFKTGFVLNRISSNDRVRSWPGESITWLSPRKVDAKTGLIEGSEVIDLNSSGDVIFYKQMIDPRHYGEESYMPEPKRYFLRLGGSGTERRFRPGIEPLAIDDQGRILVRISGPHIQQSVTAVLASGALTILKFPPDDDKTDWRHDITTLAPNGDVLLEAVGHGCTANDGLLKAVRLQRGGDLDLSQVYISGAASVKLGGDLTFAFSHQYVDRDGCGPRDSVYITDEGVKGALFAPYNSGDALPNDALFVRGDLSKGPYYLIVGGGTESHDGQVWILTEEQAAKGESEVGISLCGFTPGDVQINEIKKITPRGVLLAKTTSPIEGFDSVLLVPSSGRDSFTDWGD